MIANTMDLWAREGGILGLIIFALFGVLIFMIRQFLKAKKESESFYDKLNEDAKEDRRMAMEERQTLNVEHGRTYNRLADALDRLTDQLKRRE